MAYCPNCGNELLEGAKFCVSCGRPVAASAYTSMPSAEEAARTAAAQASSEPAEPVREEAAAPETTEAQKTETTPQALYAGAAGETYSQPENKEGSGAAGNTEEVYRPETEEPKAEQTLGQWVLTTFLSFLPIAGLVLLIIWSVSGETAPDKKNWARAMLIWHIVADVIAIIATVAVTAYFVSFYSRYGMGYWY